MSSEPFCDLECGVEPVEDFHDSFVTCEQWESLAKRAVHQADYWLASYHEASDSRYKWKTLYDKQQAIIDKQWHTILFCIGGWAVTMALFLLAVLR